MRTKGKIQDPRVQEVIISAEEAKRVAIRVICKYYSIPQDAAVTTEGKLIRMEGSNLIEIREATPADYRALSVLDDLRGN